MKKMSFLHELEEIYKLVVVIFSYFFRKANCYLLYKFRFIISDNVRIFFLN